MIYSVNFSAWKIESSDFYFFLFFFLLDLKFSRAINVFVWMSDLIIDIFCIKEIYFLLVKLYFIGSECRYTNNFNYSVGILIIDDFSPTNITFIGLNFSSHYCNFFHIKPKSVFFPWLLKHYAFDCIQDGLNYLFALMERRHELMSYE